MNWTCFLRGHEWGPWRHWSANRPRIVRASLEYMNITTNERDCQRCGIRQSEQPKWIRGKGTVMSDGSPAILS